MSQVPDSQPEPKSPQGISLGELTEAFAQAMGTRPAEEPPRPADDETAADIVEESAETGVEPAAEAGDDPCPINPSSIFEAMLFVGNRESQPLSAARAAELMRGVEPEDIAELVKGLNRRYSRSGSPYQIVGEGDGYRLTLRKAFHSLRQRFYGRIREARLSQSAVDVLALVAYRQPLTSDQINRLRGKPSNHMLAQLVRRGLLRLERMKNRRRTAQYFTTDRFLDLFGLEALDELPRSEELDRS